MSWKVVDARGDPPPRVSPLQTSPEHRAHCVGACVSEGPGLLLLTLAVGLCGCAFVPLSKHDPPRRMAAAMRDAEVSAVVVDDDDDSHASSRRRLLVCKKRYATPRAQERKIQELETPNRRRRIAERTRRTVVTIFH